MSVITPKDLAGRNFSLSFRGYNKEEVDAYITKVINNYSMLYRRCAELEEQVAVANVRLENIDKEEKRARNSLNSASETSDRIIAEAYEKADNILVSIKRNCDAILRDFRDKVDAKKDALAEMNARAELFKNELFEKYKAHIELIEKLSPDFEFDDDLSSNEHVARVITELKHEIEAEYDISVGYDDPESEMYSDENDLPTEEEINAIINDITKKNIIEPEEETKDAEAQTAENEAEKEKETEIKEPPVKEPEKVVVRAARKRTRKSTKKDVTSVLEMLKEYEEADARNIPKIEAQLMLDVDDASEVLIESTTKK